MGCQKKAIFLAPVVKTCQRGNFGRSGYCLVQLRVLEYTFQNFFSEAGLFEGKNSGAGCKHFS